MKTALTFILVLMSIAASAADFPVGYRKDFGSIKCAAAAKTAAETALTKSNGSILGYKVASENGRYRTFEVVGKDNTKSQSAYVRTKKTDCDIVEVDLNI